MLGLKAFVAAVLGGIGSIPGAMVGGIVIGLCECFVSAIGLSAWKDAVTFAILIIVLLFKPTGFLGRKVQERCKEGMKMNKNRKTLKMPVRYLMNAVLVVLLFLALSYMTGSMLSTYQNKVLMTVGINIILAVSLNVATGYLGQLPLGHAGFMAWVLTPAPLHQVQPSARWRFLCHRPCAGRCDGRPVRRPHRRPGPPSDR